MQIGGACTRTISAHNGRGLAFFFFCARGRLARKKSKRTGGEMAIPIPRASKGILALKNTEVRELFRRRLRLWDALVALMPWLGVIRGDEERKIL